MTKKRLLEWSLIILLVPFFLTSYGTMNEVPALWWSGLMLLAVGGVIPPVTRFVYDDGDGNNEGDDTGKDQQQR